MCIQSEMSIAATFRDIRIKLFSRQTLVGIKSSPLHVIALVVMCLGTKFQVFILFGSIDIQKRRFWRENGLQLIGQYHVKSDLCK